MALDHWYQNSDHSVILGCTSMYCVPSLTQMDSGHWRPLHYMGLHVQSLPMSKNVSLSYYTVMDLDGIESVLSKTTGALGLKLSFPMRQSPLPNLWWICDSTSGAITWHGARCPRVLPSLKIMPLCFCKQMDFDRFRIHAVLVKK